MTQIWKQLHYSCSNLPDEAPDVLTRDLALNYLQSASYFLQVISILPVETQEDGSDDPAGLIPAKEVQKLVEHCQDIMSRCVAKERSGKYSLASEEAYQRNLKRIEQDITECQEACSKLQDEQETLSKLMKEEQQALEQRRIMTWKLRDLQKMEDELKSLRKEVSVFPEEPKMDDIDGLQAFHDFTQDLDRVMTRVIALAEEGRACYSELGIKREMFDEVLDRLPRANQAERRLRAAAAISESLAEMERNLRILQS